MDENVYECTQTRSQFRIKIFFDDKSISVSTNLVTKNLIHLAFPQLEIASPRGWIKSNKYPNVYNLWLPDDCYDQKDIEDLKKWAEVQNGFIWLGTNKYTRDYFYGTEIDFCVAYDWNFYFDTDTKSGRTPTGKAEYWLKYHAEELSESQLTNYYNILAAAVQKCVLTIPINLNEYVVTTIPATCQGQSKLAWALSENIAQKNGLNFVGATLTKDKPQMKNLSVEGKIQTWRKIYADEDWVQIPSNICRKNILIVDDLFQSGASLYCYAEFLKEKKEVQHIVAVTSVKSQKDGDNT